jgi:Concanavalin A-like lectin/glucanases superfamily
VTLRDDELAELRSLLDVLVEEVATAEQVRRMEELVLTHPEAEAFYVQYMTLVADLDRHFAGKPGQAVRSLSDRLGDAAPTLPMPRRKWRRWVGLAVGLAAAVLGAVMLWPRPVSVDAGGQVQATAEPTDDTVAILLQAPGAVWDDSDTPPRVGAPLRPGWLHLMSGAAHIEFYNGATVILQGPAEFQLISRTRAYCAWGKLRATVPPQAHGFAIKAPRLDLVDRGTEFGLKVGEGEGTEVQVFHGKVDLYDPDKSETDPPMRALRTGQGLRVDGPGKPKSVKPTPADFLTARDLAEQTQKAINERKTVWAAATAGLRRDPSLVAYYPFENAQSWTRTLSDEAGERAQPRDGAVVGAAWAEGRWPGKRGLEFKRVSDRVRVTIPGEYDSVTFAAWVRVDALTNQNSSLIMAEKWVPGALHWQIGREGTLILGVRSPLNVNNAHYHAEGVFTPDRLGRWSLLAVVYDAAAGRVTHYIDGRPVSHEPILVEELKVHVGDAELGNWNSGTSKGKDPIRFLSGCMDEFMMFSRPLDEAEIARLYEDGRPPA